MISAYFVDNPPKIALLPVEFIIKSDLSAFEISIDSVDNPPKNLCYHSWYYLSLTEHLLFLRQFLGESMIIDMK